MIISWDIGTKNLAHCIIYNKNKIILPYDIISWDLHCFECPHISIVFFTEIIDYLNNWKETWEHILYNEELVVLIERQPTKNSILQMVMVIISSWFIQNFSNIKLNLVSPNDKAYINKKDKYTDRKKKSISAVSEFLKSNNTYNSGNLWLEYFDTFKKQDDLADTILQTLFWLEKN